MKRLGAVFSIFLIIPIAFAQTKKSKFGDWEIRDSKDEMTSERQLGANLRSTDGNFSLLFLNKKESTPDRLVFIVGFSMLGKGLIKDDQHPLVRFDEEDAYHETWSRLENGKRALFIYDDDFIRNFVKAKTFRVRFDEYLQGETTVTFNVSHFGEVIEALKAKMK
jgi:hypothetical protein